MRRNLVVILIFISLLAIGYGLFRHNFPAPSAGRGGNVLGVTTAKEKLLELSEMRKRIAASREKIRKFVGTLPDFGIITGTGLTNLVEEMQIAGRVPFDELGFPVPTVGGHKGEFLWGELHGRKVFALCGRFHLYEGYTPQEIALPIRALAQEGMKYLVITNAAGGLDNNFHPGEVLLIRDHINCTGRSPLLGAYDPAWGRRFPDMAQVWDAEAAAMLARYAREQQIKLHQGVYVGVLGPQLETPAETRVYKNMGGKAIGMSTVMEAIAAVQAGVRIVGLSAIGNVNNPDAMASIAVGEIDSAADRATPAIRKLLGFLAEKWH